MTLLPYPPNLVNGPVPIHTDTTLTDQTNVEGNGIYNIDAGTTLTISGPLRAGLYQIFGGAGTVQWGNRAVNKVRPEWHGAGRTGDDSGAINNAIAALPASGGVLELGPRNYPLVASGLNLAGKTDLRIEGSGSNATQLVMNAAGITLLNLTGVCSRIKIAGLWMGSYAARASGGGLSVVGTSGVHADTVLIEHCTIQNVPTPVALAYVDVVRFYTVRIEQSITGAVVGAAMTMHDVKTGSFRDLAITVTTGTFGGDALAIDYNCDTILVDGAAIDGGGHSGVHLLQTVTSGTTGPRLVRLQNCYSEGNVQHGFQVDAGRIVRLNSCHSAVNSLSGYALLGGDDVEINGGDAAVNGQHGCAVVAGTGLGVRGLHAMSNGTAASNTHDGINIAATVAHCRVLGCVSGNYVYSPAVQRYGICTAAGSDYLLIVNNDVNAMGNLTGGIGSFSTGAHNVLANNI